MVKRTKLNRDIPAAFPIVFIIALLIFSLASRIKINKLKSNRKIAFAKVIEIWKGAKTVSADFRYVFTVKGISYKSDQGQGIYTQDKFKILNKYLPVLYDPQDPANNYLLMTRQDYRDFHVPIPDSLKWELDIFEKDKW